MTSALVVRQQPIVDGAPGPQGDPGDPGPPGVDGDPGPAGPPGSGITDATAIELLAFTSGTVDLTTIYRATSSSGDIIQNRLYRWDSTSDALEEIPTIPLGAAQTEQDLSAVDWADRETDTGVFESGTGYHFRAQDLDPDPGVGFIRDTVANLWRLEQPTVLAFDVELASGTASGANQVVKSVDIPAGLLMAARIVEVQFSPSRANTTNAMDAAVVYIGTAGTVSDTALHGLTSNALTGTQKSRNLTHRYAVIDSTHLQLIGAPIADGSVSDSSTSAANVSYVVPNMASNALKISIACDMAGATTPPSVGHLIVIGHP